MSLSTKILLIVGLFAAGTVIPGLGNAMGLTIGLLVLWKISKNKALSQAARDIGDTTRRAGLQIAEQTRRQAVEALSKPIAVPPPKE